MHSLADAWLTFVNFLEKVFQLLLGHCLPLKYFLGDNMYVLTSENEDQTYQEKTIL